MAAVANRSAARVEGSAESMRRFKNGEEANAEPLPLPRREGPTLGDGVARPLRGPPSLFSSRGAYVFANTAERPPRAALPLPPYVFAAPFSL